MKAPFVAIFLCCSGWVAAQNPYFQQVVNYQIEVTLDDQKHELSGVTHLEYLNNSSDTLTEIWMHLWGNAFKTRRSAFCKQKLRDGDGKFYFAKGSDLGGFKNLDFSADGQTIPWKYDPKNPDIAILSLPKPLLPGSRVHLSTPFQLKIPSSFSRLGHVETTYQITQWYPKPAVYDHKGWHAMPYLDIGEFYSEFGAFEVTITLPDNYVVGATGILQTPSEIEFLEKKALETRRKLAETEHHRAEEIPASSTTMKTIRYTAEQVHDFAWFADKRFWVLKDTARLASGKTVDCWAMFPSAKETALKTAQSKYWEKGAFYVRRAVEFYSEKVGEYPYPQATAVHSALSAGGGMEYPMVTVIGNVTSAKSLDNVITHEVGHNWFYGILASNERDHPFMDEGLNSYYENRYMREYYGAYTPVELPDFILNEQKQGSIVENGYLILAREKEDTPPDSPSSQFSPLAYGLQAYMKTALCLHWLERAEGTQKFDLAMQKYYSTWQFRHPYPEDFKAVLIAQKMEADWFFEAMQTQKQVDYTLKSIKPALKIGDNDKNHSREKGWNLGIVNKGALNAPFAVTAIKAGKPVKTQWFSAQDLEPRNNIFFGIDSVDAFEIDFERKTLDLNRKNNFRRTSGLFPGIRPFEFRPLAIFQNSRRNTLALLPWLGWNNYDKTMLGVVLYNPPIPSRKFQYYLLPGYATGSKTFVGIADLRYKFYPGLLFPKITIGVSAKTFDFDYLEDDPAYRKFYRIVPQVRAELRSGSMSFQHALNFRTLFIGREEAVRDREGQFLGETWKNNTIYELRYEAEQKALPNPYRFQIAFETQHYHDALDRPAKYLRSTVEWRQKFHYRPNSKVTMRWFAGYFIQNTQRHENVTENALSLNPQGFNDYKFDQIFLARSGANGFMGRQVSQSDGGFKGAFGPSLGATLGNSNQFLIALNLKADLPVKLPLGFPIKPYFDLGYFDDATTQGEARPQKEQLLWSGGFILEFFKGGLEFYFPLINSSYLQDRYCEQGGGTNSSGFFCGGNYRKMISWSMRLNFSDPVKMAESAIR